MFPMMTFFELSLEDSDGNFGLVPAHSELSAIGKSASVAPSRDSRSAADWTTNFATEQRVQTTTMKSGKGHSKMTSNRQMKTEILISHNYIKGKSITA
jgi:hypothetical protein